jgi:hypothetical protein
MASKLRGIFITNPDDLNATIPGGVQICSKEFLAIIQNTGIEVSIFEVSVSKKLAHRLLRRLRIDAYNLYDVQNYEETLCREIERQQATYIFINKSELVKFSALIRKRFGNRIQIIIMSHGNETYDLLHEISGVFSRLGWLARMRESFRIGLNLHAESHYRLRYVDLVCAMSREEVAIERWLGTREVLFLPRLVEEDCLPWQPNYKYVGYVGTLNHTPNLVALEAVLEEIAKRPAAPLRCRVVGGPVEIGKQLADKYPFVDYLGRLSDQELMDEAKQWAFFLNPIFWYSRGASMKLAKAIGWGLPIITTQAGRRGYDWRTGNLLVTPDDAKSFVNILWKELLINQRAGFWQGQTILVQNSSPNLNDLSEALLKQLKVSASEIVEYT